MCVCWWWWEGGGGGGGGAWLRGPCFFVVFYFGKVEGRLAQYLNIPLWCVSGVGGGVGRGRSVFTQTHTLLK